METVEAAIIFLAGMVLFVFGCALLAVAAIAGARVFTAVATARVHLSEAGIANPETVERSPEPALAVRPPDIPSDDDLATAVNIERRLLMEQAARGDFSSDDNVREGDFVGTAQGGMYRNGAL